jgi:hypothetical protein
MIEKVTTKDYNNALEEKDSLHKVKAIDGSGNDMLVSPDIVAKSGGCGIYRSSSNILYGKWYRIAVGNIGHASNAVLLMVGNYFNNEAPHSQLYYISADGYSGMPSIVQLANSGRVISKARILYKPSTTEGPIIEIFVIALHSNKFIFSYSCNMNFTFQDPIEVSETPESGYTVKEFTF